MDPLFSGAVLGGLIQKNQFFLFLHNSISCGHISFGGEENVSWTVCKRCLWHDRRKSRESLCVCSLLIESLDTVEC